MVTRTPNSMRRIGLFGGTFDPVHQGHIALAHAAQSALQLDELRFLPAGQPWQKQTLSTSAVDRLAMLELALAAEQQANWVCDSREIQRETQRQNQQSTPTYTIDTLRELRAEFGNTVSLVWLLGSDQLHNLPTWKAWTELFDLAHFAYTDRVDEAFSNHASPAPAAATAAPAWLSARLVSALPNTPAGSVVHFPMPAMPISSTQIRLQIRTQLGTLTASPSTNLGLTHQNLLVAPTVLHYIQQHQLYIQPL